MLPGAAPSSGNSRRSASSSGRERVAATRSGRRGRGAAQRLPPAATAPTRAWSPLSSTSGTAWPRNSAGRVYCGYSSRPVGERLVVPRRRVAHDPGHEPRHRVDHDRAAASPPARTKSPTDSSPSHRWSATRWSTPS